MTIRELTPDLQELARKNVNEDPKRIKQDIEAIKEWLKKQPHINARDDDQWILTFLRGCKFSLERTKEKIDMYYMFKDLIPELLRRRDPLQPGIQKILNYGTIIELPKPDNLGRHVMVIRIEKCEFKNYSLLDNMKFQFMSMDTLLKDDDRNVIAGGVVVVDYKYMSLDHIAQISPSLLKKCMTCYQDAYPIRPQAIHFVNTSSFFDSAFNIIKSFLKNKLKERLHVHGTNMEKLHEYVPRQILPSDFGGELPSCDELAVEWRKKIEESRKWLVDDDGYGTNEKKRIGKPKTPADILGMEGSFRSLAID